MTLVHMLAQGDVAPWIAPAARAVVFIAMGATLIAVGALRRRARMRWDREDDGRLLHPDGPEAINDRRVQRPRSGGTWLIAGGTALLILGLLHILDLIATLHVSGVI